MLGGQERRHVDLSKEWGRRIQNGRLREWMIEVAKMGAILTLYKISIQDGENLESELFSENIFWIYGV